MQSSGSWMSGSSLNCSFPRVEWLKQQTSLITLKRRIGFISLVLCWIFSGPHKAYTLTYLVNCSGFRSVHRRTWTWWNFLAAHLDCDSYTVDSDPGVSAVSSSCQVRALVVPGLSWNSRMTVRIFFQTSAQQAHICVTLLIVWSDDL